MKKETLDKGLQLSREIDYTYYVISKLEDLKKEYSERGHIKLDGYFEFDIKIPYSVFENWFESEIKNKLDKIEGLTKELDDL